MKYLKTIFLLNFLLFIFGCGTIKEGFVNQKKTSSDEFLVEKKSPLVMPPDYDELPVPKQAENESQSEVSNIKNLVFDQNNNDNSLTEADKNFENSLLEKIKKN